FLRMNDLALEALHAGPARHVSGVVIIIAGAHLQEVAAIGDLVALGAFDIEGPARLRRRPGCALDLVPVTDLAVDAVVPRGLVEIIGDRLLAAPGPEAVAERVHIGIGANAGITEQVPGAAERFAPFQDDEGLFRTVALQVIGNANPGEAGTDDDDVEIRLLRFGLERCDIGRCGCRSSHYRWCSADVSAAREDLLWHSVLPGPMSWHRASVFFF